MTEEKSGFEKIIPIKVSEKNSSDLQSQLEER